MLLLLLPTTWTSSLTSTSHRLLYDPKVASGSEGWSEVVMRERERAEEEEDWSIRSRIEVRSQEGRVSSRQVPRRRSLLLEPEVRVPLSRFWERKSGGVEAKVVRRWELRLEVEGRRRLE